MIDPSFGDARLAAIRAAARERTAEQWPVIRGHLAAARDAEDLTFLVDGLRTIRGIERWIGSVVAAEPGDPLALLVSGACHVQSAWHARGSGGGPVSEEQQETFAARLAEAEQQLLEVAELSPAWAAPWYFLQITGRGRQVGPDIAERRFEATVRRAPFHAAAHRERLQGLTWKSGGSHEQAREFARASMLGAPAGSPLGELVAMAHLEEWLALGGDPESSYLGRSEVLDALHEAAARSVAHPDFVRRRDWTVAFNTFAMAFALAGDLRAARPLFGVLGKQATEVPWRYLDERSPLVPFLAWRARVGR